MKPGQQHQTTTMLHKTSLVLSLAATTGVVWGWTTTTTPMLKPLVRLSSPPKSARQQSAQFMAPTDGDVEDDKIERTSFDQAGASLIEEEDQKRMEQMGDFDSNDSVRFARFLLSRVVAC